MDHVALLKQFIGMCQSNPAVLHSPEFEFFRDYLTSLGATLPPKPETKPDPAPQAEEPKVEETSEPEAPKPAEIPYPEIDNEGVIEPENGPELPMGDASKEPSEEEIEKASEERGKAQEAFSNGEFETALTHFTAAIEANPGSAMLHAKRANVLLKLKRPIAAIADCDKAISINPDSAQGYKFRGRAQRLLGKWVEAKTDLATACKLDYDDVANEWLKEVEPNKF
uniref:TPR_REGION domain-containing protein n=1 Tax=Caenorhabditis japonica TaxID=281687 RepID=A0A8R1HJR4_CAEJA